PGAIERLPWARSGSAADVALRGATTASSGSRPVLFWHWHPGEHGERCEVARVWSTSPGADHYGILLRQAGGAHDSGELASSKGGIDDIGIPATQHLVIGL